MNLNANLLPLATLAIVLSGCIAATGSEADGEGPVAAAGPAFDDTTGSIVGAVHTDEILPITGAQVGIVGTTLATTTDEAGGFSLNFVPPGTHTVSVIALGFQSASKPVDVSAGAVSENVDFILAQLPSTGPYSFTEIYSIIVGGNMIKATPSCMYASQLGLPVSSSSAKTCQGTLSCTELPCDIGYGHCNQEGSPYSKYGCMFNNDWQTIMGEVSWTPTTSLNGRGWSWEVMAPNVTSGGVAGGHAGGIDQSDLHDWWQLSSKNPIQTRIDRATVLEGSPSGTAGNHPMTEADVCGVPDGKQGAPGGCDWHWRIFPGWCTINALTGGLAGCEQTGPDFAVDQTGNPVTVYFSYAIREELPPGFTAIPDQ